MRVYGLKIYLNLVHRQTCGVVGRPIAVMRTLENGSNCRSVVNISVITLSLLLLLDNGTSRRPRETVTRRTSGRIFYWRKPIIPFEINLATDRHKNKLFLIEKLSLA